MHIIYENFQPNPGYLLAQLDPEQLAPIEQEVQAIAANQGQDYPTAHQGLVGVINRAYHLTASRSHVEQLVAPLALAHRDHWFDPDGFIPRDQQLSLSALWVNFQQRLEYNPLHNHQGAYSFVIWLSIPYTRQQETDTGPGLRPDRPNGDFHFVYTNTLGQIKSHPLNSYGQRQGQLCLFPAELNHIVYPYYSTQDLRVSVSGNLSWSTQ